MTLLRATLSGTPIEDELRAIEEGLARIPIDPEVRFDRSAHDPALLAILVPQWRYRMAFEHRSSTVFSQLAHQLFEANAPLDCKVVMLRMAQDELRHTATCADVITALGGVPEAEVDLTIEPLATHRGVSLEERVLRNVIYTTCTSEMIACARFVATLDGMTEPYLRQQTRRLLADEILHAQFGIHYLESQRAYLEAHPEVITSLEKYLTHAFAVIEGELAPRGTLPPRPDATARALGADDAHLAREVFYGTMQGAVVPGLARFGIDAERAWTSRSRA